MCVRAFACVLSPQSLHLPFEAAVQCPAYILVHGGHLLPNIARQNGQSFRSTPQKTKPRAWQDAGEGMKHSWVVSSTLVLLPQPEQSSFGTQVLSSGQYSLPCSTWHESPEGLKLKHSCVMSLASVLPAHPEQSPSGLHVLSSGQYSFPPCAWHVSLEGV